MLWVQLIIGLIGLAREILKDLREKKNCDKKQTISYLKNAKKNVRQGRLNGSSALPSELFLPEDDINN